MKTLTVDLADRSYPIYIGDDLFSKSLLAKHISATQVLVVSNEVVAPLYLESLLSQLDSFKVDTLVLPDGESFKNLTTLNLVFDRLLELSHNRTTTLIALGGGVVGDMTGFAAACYQRGVNFIQVPTTLLSQVDSSVGGKTGVNHPLGKNMIGAFYQPQCVLIDTSVLNSLPQRELSAGLAEVIKYGFIYDQEFFAWLELNMPRLMAMETEALSYAIERSCAIKAEVVAADEREGGIRAILNFGHTFGHAIESAMGYGTWLHGEAVAAGTAMALALSEKLSWLSAEDNARGIALLKAAGLPVLPPKEMNEEKFLSLMARDKKVIDGQLRLVLLKGIGKANVTNDFTLVELKSCIKESLAV